MDYNVENNSVEINLLNNDRENYTIESYKSLIVKKVIISYYHLLLGQEKVSKEKM